MNRAQGVGRLQVGGGRVLHVHGVDQVRAIAHPTKTAPPGTVQQMRNQVPVARTPNQMRPQRTANEAGRAAGGQHVLLGQRLRAGIVAEPAPRIGNGLVDALLAPAVEDDARAAGIHQPADAVRPATLDDVPGRNVLFS